MNFSARALFFSFAGRINRATYWTRVFPVLLVLSLIVNASLIIERRVFGAQGPASLFLMFCCLWPIFAVTIKRLHDRGRSAWFLLTFLIPVAGPIWLLIEVWFLRGTDGANRYGDAPSDEGLSRRWVIPLEVVGSFVVIALLAWIFLSPIPFAAALRHALSANGYELLRMNEPVSGAAAIPAGNLLILMQVDGTASVRNVEMGQCDRVHIVATANDQACRVEGSEQTLHFLIGSPGRTPAFSIETAEGRAIIILSADFLSANAEYEYGVDWLLEEINRPVYPY
jgi:uncharacterized membrane protein YhaH (DUF805 family)